MVSEALGAALQQPRYERGAVLDGLTSRHVTAVLAARALLVAWGLRDCSSTSPAPVPAAEPVPAASKAQAGKGSKPASPMKVGHASQGAAAERAAAELHPADHVPVWGGQQRVYLVELTGAPLPPVPSATLAALQPSVDSTVQSGMDHGQAPCKPATAPIALPLPSSNAGLAELTSIVAGASNPRSALTVRRVSRRQGPHSSPEEVHRDVCGLAWESGQLRCALPRVDADTALIPEPYTMQARRSSCVERCSTSNDTLLSSAQLKLAGCAAASGPGVPARGQALCFAAEPGSCEWRACDGAGSRDCKRMSVGDSCRRGGGRLAELPGAGHRRLSADHHIRGAHVPHVLIVHPPCCKFSYVQSSAALAACMETWKTLCMKGTASTAAQSSSPWSQHGASCCCIRWRACRSALPLLPARSVRTPRCRSRRSCLAARRHAAGRPAALGCGRGQTHRRCSLGCRTRGWPWAVGWTLGRCS